MSATNSLYGWTGEDVLALCQRVQRAPAPIDATTTAHYLSIDADRRDFDAMRARMGCAVREVPGELFARCAFLNQWRALGGSTRPTFPK